MNQKKLFETLESRFLLAADLVLDLRVAGTGGKSAAVSAGSAVTLDLYAMVRDGNGNTNDEKIQIVQGAFKSAVGGLLMDMGLAQPQAPLDNSLGHSGLNVDLDADGDKDAGSITSGDANDFFIATSGLNAASSPKTIESLNGATYSVFLAGEVTLTAKNTGSSTTVNFVPRAGSSTNLTQTWYRDGVFTQAQGTDARVAAGTPVTITLSATDTSPPTAALSASTLTAGGGSSYTFKVTYADPSGLNTSTIGGTEISVAGPAGFSQTAKYVSGTGTSTSITATYSIVPADGIIDALDNGTYTVTLKAGKVKDTKGNVASASQVLGSFSWAVPYVVKSSTGTLVIDGSGGNDSISASGSSSSISVTRNSATTSWSSVSKIIVNGVGGADTLNLYSVSGVPATIDGGSGNDSIIGTSANDVLKGGDGTDTMAGGLGNDILDGGLGNDIFDGSGGTDTADYSSRTSAVNLTLDAVANDGTSGSEFDNIYLTVENLNGGTGNDKLTGSGKDNAINGGSGNDSLVGNGGNDVLAGGSGNDTITGGSGYDKMYGNSGDDYIYARDGVASEIVDGSTGTDRAQFDSTDSRTSIEITLA